MGSLGRCLQLSLQPGPSQLTSWFLHPQHFLPAWLLSFRGLGEVISGCLSDESYLCTSNPGTGQGQMGLRTSICRTNEKMQAFVARLPPGFPAE